MARVLSPSQIGMGCNQSYLTTLWSSYSRSYREYYNHRGACSQNGYVYNGARRSAAISPPKILLTAVDVVSNPDSPSICSEINVDIPIDPLYSSMTIGTVIYGTHLYVCSYCVYGSANSGIVSTFDISTPSAPTFLNTVVDSSPVWNSNGFDVVSFEQDGVGYLAICDRGILIFSLSNPSTPSVVGYWSVANTTHRSLTYRNGMIYTSTVDAVGQPYPRSIVVFDVSDPSTPSPINSLQLEALGSTEPRIDNYGDILYATVGLLPTYVTRVAVVDATDPMNLSILELLRRGSGGSYIATPKTRVCGHYLYCGSPFGDVFDVFQPETPVYMGMGSGSGPSYLGYAGGPFEISSSGRGVYFGEDSMAPFGPDPVWIFSTACYT